jgi:ABC-type sugar transport system permease subunit
MGGADTCLSSCDDSGASLQGDRRDSLMTVGHSGPSLRSVASRLRAILGPDWTSGYLFVLPLVLLDLVLLAYPILQAMFLSFYKKDVGSPAVFVGFQNYAQLLTEDPHFRSVIGNSIEYTAFSLAGKLLLGLGLALTLNERVVLRNVWRGYMLIPWAMPTAVLAILMRWMFDANVGVINYILQGAGLIGQPVTWLVGKQTAMLAVVLANIWRGFPFFGLTFLAGMQAIAKELYEAAEVDGASVLQKFRYITLPGLSFVILVTFTLSMIWTFNDFDIVFLMTGGGPNWSTHIFATFAYQLGFKEGSLGYAAASSMMVLPLEILMLALLFPMMLREGD